MANLPVQPTAHPVQSPPTTLLARLSAPHVATETDLAEARGYLAPISGSTQDGHWLDGRILTLKAHFFRPDDHAALQEKLAEDWLDALDGFPRWAVERAVKDYLRDHGRREPPAPGDIAALCRRHVSHLALLIERQEKAAAERAERREPPSEESKARVQALVDDLKRQVQG